MSIHDARAILSPNSTRCLAPPKQQIGSIKHKIRQTRKSSMPELPEVQTVVTSLAPKLVGRCLLRVIHLRRDIVGPQQIDWTSLVTGQTVTAVTRRGKRIVMTQSDGNRWFIHLGMTGQLTIETVDAPVRKHSHLIIDLGSRTHLRFVDPRRFGGVFWLGNAHADDGMGPEPLGIRPLQLIRRLQRTGRNVKTTLLDQRFLAGIGNIYADEALFAARIHPLTPANQLSEQQSHRLCRAIKRTLKMAIRARGSSLQDYVDADGQPGSYQLRHKVYNRAGQPCGICRTLITRIVVGQRSTCFCPNCQQLINESLTTTAV